MPKWWVHFVGVNSRKNIDSATMMSMRRVGPTAAPATRLLRTNASVMSARQNSIMNIAKRRVMEPSTDCSNRVA